MLSGILATSLIDSAIFGTEEISLTTPMTDWRVVAYTNLEQKIGMAGIGCNYFMYLGNSKINTMFLILQLSSLGLIKEIGKSQNGVSFSKMFIACR